MRERPKSVYLWRIKPKIHNIYKTKANGALTREKSKCHDKSTRKFRKVRKHNRSETLTHSQREEEIERGCEEERKGSPIPIFPLANFGIVGMLAG